MIEALNDLLPNDGQELSSVMTPGEYHGMVSLVDGWLNSLDGSSQPGKEAQR
jgi:hypothetical protein